MIHTLSAILQSLFRDILVIRLFLGCLVVSWPRRPPGQSSSLSLSAFESTRRIPDYLASSWFLCPILAFRRLPDHDQSLSYLVCCIPSLPIITPLPGSVLVASERPLDCLVPSVQLDGFMKAWRPLRHLSSFYICTLTGCLFIEPKDFHLRNPMNKTNAIKIYRRER